VTIHVTLSWPVVAALCAAIVLWALIRRKR